MAEPAAPGARSRRSLRAPVAATAVALAVLAGPVHARAETSLTVHMWQHVVLLVVVAPLLAVGPPPSAALGALPARWRRGVVARWCGRAPTSRPSPWVAWVLASLAVTSAVMLAWHAPALYEAAAGSSPLHVLEHVAFVVTATAFWGVLLRRRPYHGATVPLLFLASLPGTALGAAMTFASHPWYLSYATAAGGRALQDQQLAGVVMWAFGGLAYIVAAGVVFGLWLQKVEDEHPEPSTPGGAPVVPPPQPKAVIP